MYTVYIMQSEKDFSYYIGHTDNLARRLEEHNRGKNKYTKNKIPWKTVYKEFFSTRSEAMKRELKLKRMKSREYLEKTINTFG